MPSLEQLERTGKPMNHDHNEYPPSIPFILRPFTHASFSGTVQPRRTRLYDRLGLGILKCVIFVLGLACVIGFGGATTAFGNEILSTTHPDHSTDTETAAIVGSIGGIFAYGFPVLCYISLKIIQTSLKGKGFLAYLTILTMTNFACAAVLGPIGCIIYLKLTRRNSGPGGLSVRNSTLMGIIGGSFWMILVIGLSAYLSRTPKREAESGRTAFRYQEQCRDLDIAFAR